jgi:hypothetical protein
MQFMAWPRDTWNYHPSLPVKRLQDIDAITAVGGNVLVWSCLGSGAIGLPYLDREAFEPLPGRLRLYGHLNDAEFCAECARRGILVFGMVWKAQLWEFPAEFSDDESELLALNITRGVGKPGWLGMRELSQHRYPKLYRPMSDFFPDGLVNSDGETVIDYLDEFKTVTLDGADIVSRWLLAPGHEHRCYMPCGNDPTYIAYLKREIELIIDAGAGGVFVDEPNTQQMAMRSGGCFCKDCVKGFRQYLREHPSPETDGLDLDSFDYGEYLRGLGYHDANLLDSAGEKRWSVPLLRQFALYNHAGADKNMAELAAFVHQCSLEKRGHRAPVAANLYNALPEYSALRKHLDLVAGEKSGLERRQDGWYRFALAFENGRPGCWVQDPNQYILDIVEDIKNGQSDAYLLFRLEPLAQGVNMAAPYGAWLINLVKESMYSDMRVETKLGTWLTEHEGLLAADPAGDTAIVFDERAAFEAHEFHSDRPFEPAAFPTFHTLCQHLCEQGVLYRVIYVSSDDPLSTEQLKGIRRLLLPDCLGLAVADVGAIERWMAGGGEARAVGQQPAWLVASECYSSPEDPRLLAWVRQGNQLITCEDSRGIGFQLHRNGPDYVLHLVNYNLNEQTRKIDAVPEVRFELGWCPESVRACSFPEPGALVEIDGSSLTARGVGIYTVIHLAGGSQSPGLGG